MNTARSESSPDDDQLIAYDYELPTGRIASHPLAERSRSRLLVHNRQDDSVEHRCFAEIGAFFEQGDLLVVNDVRVIPARLSAKRSTGGRVEVLLHPTGRTRLDTEAPPDPDSVRFRGQAMLRPSSRVRRGEVLVLSNGSELQVEDEPGGDLRAVRSDSPLVELLRGGELPLPPYLDRDGPPTEVDAERYQTVFAESDGAIAAPTAGLHFTPELLHDLSTAGVDHTAIRLFVGPGTFLPIRSDRLSTHRMHEEAYVVPGQARHKIARCRQGGGRVIAVGTTTTRALESASDDRGIPRAGAGHTELMIHPPHEFRCIDALLTNFHLPRSTLLALVSAFAGRRRVLELYREAVAQGYRFYSYGDAMLLL